GGGEWGAHSEGGEREERGGREARRYARAKTPRKHLGETKPSRRLRYIPAAVRRVVYERDGGRCRYVDSQGRRCTARDHLQFHHRHPYAYGGGHDPANISLMCRTHNAYLAEIDYGKRHLSRERRRPDGVPERPAPARLAAGRQSI